MMVMLGSGFREGDGKGGPQKFPLGPQKIPKGISLSSSMTSFESITSASGQEPPRPLQFHLLTPYTLPNLESVVAFNMGL